MHVILTGATGLVGSGVLHHILSLTPPAAAASTSQISRVSILSRNPNIPLLTHPHRPTSNAHTEIDIITHSDFTTYPPTLLSKLTTSTSGPDSDSDSSPIAVIWALGMSQNDATSPEQYTTVTKTYAVNAASALATAFSPRRVNFVYVSGEGATKNPGVFTPLFGRVKGETETELLALAGRHENLSVYNVRPAGVDPGAKLGGQRAVDEIWGERLKGSGGVAQKATKAVVFPLLRAGIWAGMHSPTEELARVFVRLGLGDGRALSGVGVEDGGWTLKNVALRRLAREEV